MATQQVLFSETIAGMKKAFKRKAYGTTPLDATSQKTPLTSVAPQNPTPIPKSTTTATEGISSRNEPGSHTRGNWYRPTAQAPTDRAKYVEYAGVRRPILHRNPPLIDDEGYEIDSDDDADRLHEAETHASEINPYANIQLEHLLAPLTSVTGLSSHQTLSKPFISKTLTRLVDQSCDNLRKENRSLWQVRHLLTSLCGDYTWVPCKMMVRPSDIDLFTDDHVARHLLSLSRAHVTEPQEVMPPTSTNGNANSPDGIEPGQILGSANELHLSDKAATEDADVAMVDADVVGQNSSRPEPGAMPNGDPNGPDLSPPMKQEDSEGKSVYVGVDKKSQHVDDAVNQKFGGDKEPGATSPEKVADAVADATPEARHLKESSNGVPDGSVPPRGLEHLFVHPMFVAPTGTKPDRDVGLPEQEAEDIRRLLALYVQKQEEVCRGAKKLFLGLLRADRLRKNVLHWSKAEAHSGPNRDMSDGEDWYDMEEWGLTEDLKKGQDEEEEDTQLPGKKTRNRRA
ncbi:hypothetical protein AK830_g8176 [Neonectria ditissima]|uniref:Transcriptional regulatory protein RXT2 N-terminal domain-containing protein n=1 Tax=Neonectria ditissima TaxID=78410 RepID=A0A0P7B8M4_9HYPO|nr:hypothetical protein AK830_g8176 [Neonectria ditissima]